MKKRRRLRKEIRVALMVLFVFFIISILYFTFFENIHFWGKKSIHENSERYETKKCLIFYPEESLKSKALAMSICDRYDEEEAIVIDYKLDQHGDFHYASYAEEGVMLKDGKDASFEAWNEDLAKIVSDYLRYVIRQNESVNYKVMAEETYYADLKKEDLSFELKSDHLAVKHINYSSIAQIPYTYLQSLSGLDFGYEDEVYQKIRFVNPNQKLIAFTFDDGPYIPVSERIVETLERYDANATFFVLGSRLGSKEISFIKDSIALGNEYASHSQSHPNLTKLSLAEAKEEILIPYYDLKNGIGYEMKLYRPPYGSYNKDINAQTDLIPVLWNIDSVDWKSRDANAVFDEVIADINHNCVALFHDIYPSTADAMERLIPHLVEEGYQFVTVSELMDYLNAEEIRITFLGRR